MDTKLKTLPVFDRLIVLLISAILRQNLFDLRIVTYEYFLRKGFLSYLESRPQNWLMRRRVRWIRFTRNFMKSLLAYVYDEPSRTPTILLPELFSTSVRYPHF